MNKLNVILLVAASASGFAVVTVQDQARRNYMVLDKAQKQEIKLEQDYARLKLGQARSEERRVGKEC